MGHPDALKHTQERRRRREERKEGKGMGGEERRIRVERKEKERGREKRKEGERGREERKELEKEGGRSNRRKETKE